VTAQTPGMHGAGTHGETLAQRLAYGPIDSAVALEILKRLLKTLAFLHWSGAVHGCISPEAIILGSEGQVTLGAGLSGPGTGVLPARSIPETPAHPEYLAPEQIDGEPADARADVFAVGVIAYEMLAGKNPFRARPGASAIEIMSRIVNDPSPQLDPALAAHLPPGVAAAVQKALAKEPAGRFASAQALLDALGGPVASARPAKKTPRTQPATQKAPAAAPESGAAGPAAAGVATTPGAGAAWAPTGTALAPGAATVAPGPATAPAPAADRAPGSASGHAGHRKHKRRTGPYVALGVAMVIIVAIVAAWFALKYAGSSGLTETTGTSVATSGVTSTSIAGTPTSDSSTVVTGDSPTATTGIAPTTSTTAPATTTTLRPTIPATARVEETAAELAFTGDWSSGTGDSYSDGRFTYADNSGATVTATFSGTYLAWIAKKGPAYGKAKVTLDGTAPRTIDLFEASNAFEQKVWESGLLAPGIHTVTIEWTGKKSTSASAANICVDAFDLVGELVAVTRFEETNTHLVWTGTWTRTQADSASGGRLRYVDPAGASGASGASVTIALTGQQLEIIAAKGPTYGQAKVTLDQTKTFTVDLYSATEKWGAKVWSSGLLADGDHTIKIEWTGAKNPAATGTGINLDAVDVIGKLR
jgi:hypothetical protein